MKAIVLCSWYLLFFITANYAQQKAVIQNQDKANTNKPKLVVGLVIDQMRWDNLYRYQANYTSNGFKRLMQQGFNCENTFIPYTPTYTAPGHACVYTGSVPAINGIVGNNWYNKLTNKNEYCTQDNAANTVGSNSKAGKMSPINLFTTTITDELRLASNFKSKVIGIALKDRGAILPAGHSADAAYWYDDEIGKWITSSYYMSSLPNWVNEFNNKNYPFNYMNGKWDLLLNANKYTQSTEDDKVYESNSYGDKKVVFPYLLNAITTDKFKAFKSTPFTNEYTFNFAKEAIKNEKLGNSAFTDFLAISISSTDYIGHGYGPNALEMEDTYIRLDREIASFLEYLDASIGKDKYLLFLTADHGVAHVPAFLQEHKIPGGTANDNDIALALNKAIQEKFNISKAVLEVMNYQVYVQDSIQNRQEVLNFIVDQLLKEPYIVQATVLKDISQSTIPAPIKDRIINGYLPSRSGDVQFVFKPGFFDGGKKGTTHGLWNPYDAHIPLLFYGYGITKGKTYREVYMTDIAPTIAALLHIQMPNGCVGKVIAEAIK
jgi:predicted AlkP superfamily pyrophosphatase or phosphodiesterase